MAISTHTDEAIQTDVLDELKWDARVRPNEIGVSVKDGIVTLTGWVDSYMKKLAAEEAAHRIPGVKAVANDIVEGVSMAGGAASLGAVGLTIARSALALVACLLRPGQASLPLDRLRQMRGERSSQKHQAC